METLFLLCVIPISIFVISIFYTKYKKIKFVREIHLYPFLLSIVVLCSAYAFSMYAEVYDVEIRNGQVTGKEKKSVQCEHSYSCNCNKNGCSTCYDHSNDYDWVVYSSIPHDFKIKRINNRGDKEPPRWSSIKIGDSVSDSFSHVNYIKAAKHSLFHDATNIDLSSVPEYPNTVYDYNYVNRVLGVGVPVDPTWNIKLQNVLGKLGPIYQFNAIIILTNLDESFDVAVNVKWLGGKKNDAIIIVHTPDGKTINSVNVISWTDQNIFKIELRDSILDLKTFDFDKTLSLLETQVVRNWKRKSMRDFGYLSSDIDVSSWILWSCIVLSLVTYAGVFYGFNRNLSYSLTRHRNLW